MSSQATSTSKEDMKLNAEKKKDYEPNQFAPGHAPPIQKLKPPGLESDMNPRPVYDQLPTFDGSYAPYKGSDKLAGRKALITGGDSGIGRACAVMFAIEGADVAITYLKEEKEDAEETKREVEKRGRKALIVEADLTTAEKCKEVVETVRKEFGEINILVNNCAYQMEVEKIEDLGEDQWDHTFKTNIYTYFWMSKYVVANMKRNDTIINCASINHYVGKPNLLDYTSTKGAIVAFTRGLANQLADRGIRVNAVAPGPVWTPLVVATMTSEDLDSFGSTPLGRPAQPSEMGASFVFLASIADSAMMSGQVLHPNGGTITGS